ncbi:hypothetical protein [Streptomyces sp. NPDC088752]|uniref:hypothetical protein n=1 Tax=Streptomyces sp. NPDC088752 TaxID=3154963 RepID=UPI003415348B
MTVRTPALGTARLAIAMGFGVIQRACVPYAGASGTTSRRPDSSSTATARTCLASSGAAAVRMVSHWARTLPPAAGATRPRSVIIMPITAPKPIGARPSRTTVVVRCLGFCRTSAPFAFAASRAAKRAWRARSTPEGSGVLAIRPPSR